MKKHLTITIFGGTGDLTNRKLLPALYNLFVTKELVDFSIVVIGRRSFTYTSYCESIHEWVKQYARLPYRSSLFEEFIQHLYYYQMDFTEVTAYEKLQSFYQEHEMNEHIFYFAVAPRFFEVIAKGLTTYIPEAKNAGKVVIEKPFGEDLKSAMRLNETLESFFTKDHVYHIDHYLGKEMVQNIHTIRFLNPIFSHIWNHEHIEHIQISALEEVGVEKRGGYYDQSGALQDMVQNHLFQILSIVAMEPMKEQTREEMHRCQLEVLNNLREIKDDELKENVVLGQYFDYQKEPNVENDSETETYAALRLLIDNERWKGTPFYIRTGKKLNRREMEVVITFKQPYDYAAKNLLIIKIQPTEGVYFKFNIKEPGNSENIIPVHMDFCQSCQDIYRINTPEAYERLLMAVVNNDGAWFSSWDQISLCWNYMEVLKQKLKKGYCTPVIYPASSEGPIEADQMLEQYGHSWQK